MNEYHPNLYKPLSFDEVKSLHKKHFGKPIQVIEYHDLIHMRHLDEAFNGDDAIIIYMPTESMNFGHYVALIRNDKDKTYYFYDSYGNVMDSRLIKSKPELYTEEGNINTLIRLLKDSGYKVDYGHIKLQKIGNESATCGRHSVMRAGFRHLSNDDYAQQVRDNTTAFSFIDPDDMISKIII